MWKCLNVKYEDELLREQKINELITETEEFAVKTFTRWSSNPYVKLAIKEGNYRKLKHKKIKNLLQLNDRGETKDDNSIKSN